MNPVHFLRKTTWLEGGSLLILLFVAMPMKYAAGMPMAVSIVGMVHGLLFLLVCAMIWQVRRQAGWPLGRATLVFLGALLPFGPFVMDRRMHQYAEEWEAGRREGRPSSS